jgi:hypothetical protein
MFLEFHPLAYPPDLVQCLLPRKTQRSCTPYPEISLSLVTDYSIPQWMVPFAEPSSRRSSTKCKVASMVAILPTVHLRKHQCTNKETNKLVFMITQQHTHQTVVSYQY